MTDSTNSNDSKKLTDAELNEVIGGDGHWNADKETIYQTEYRNLRATGSFNEWYLSYYGGKSGKRQYVEGDLRARQKWIAAGCPKDRTFEG